VVNDKVVDYEVIMGITILGLLFISQPFGSSRIAFLFGPIMLVWFAFIGGTPHSSTAHALLRTHDRTPHLTLRRGGHHAAVGIYNIVTFDSGVFRAFNPYWGYLYFARRGVTGYKALGGVCLCFTGVEALYADMGHFGRWPIRVGWALIVLPSVLMSYFGQVSERVCGCVRVRLSAACDGFCCVRVWCDSCPTSSLTRM
jgi:KUP system potassium uptake protein